MGFGGAIIPSLPAAPCEALTLYDAELQPDEAGVFELDGLLVLLYLL